MQLDVSKKCVDNFKYALLNTLRVYIENPVKMGIFGGNIDVINSDNEVYI